MAFQYADVKMKLQHFNSDFVVSHNHATNKNDDQIDNEI